MFSAFKRFTKSEGESGNTNQSSESRYAPMPAALQKKFAKGVQYNMKIVLKGDHNSGKTALFRRLQGQPFVEEYVPTDEIQVANIHWNYKTHDDVVKVEVWDVVDKARSKKQFQGKLKIANSTVDAEIASCEHGLDATFLDVYKNANGVILLFDITKPWTYDYVKREVTAIPKSIPTLILGNHRDMGHNSKTVSYDTAQYFVDSLNQEEDSQRFRYAESSMKDGFGLKLIHKFFNLPFLQLQKETLRRQLEANREENLITLQELDLYYESPEANYNKFIEQRIKKDPSVAPAPAAVAAAEKNQAPPQSLGKSSLPYTSSPAAQPNANAGIKTLSSSSQPQPQIQEQISPPKEAQNLTSKSETTPAPQVPNVTSQEPATKTASPKKKPTISEALAFDFQPDESDELDNSFFRDENTNPKPTDNGNKRDVNDSSDEEEDNNPMVMSYVEDISVEQYKSTAPARRPVIPKQASSSEDES